MNDNQSESNCCGYCYVCYCYVYDCDCYVCEVYEAQQQENCWRREVQEWRRAVKGTTSYASAGRRAVRRRPRGGRRKAGESPVGDAAEWDG